jgi:hypothetical protein
MDTKRTSTINLSSFFIRVPFHGHNWLMETRQSVLTYAYRGMANIRLCTTLSYLNKCTLISFITLVRRQTPLDT